MIFKTILNAVKPFRLISLIVMYALGAGIVQYVEHIRTWTGCIQGGLLLLMVGLSLDLLALLHTLSDHQRFPEGMSLNVVKRTRLVAALTAASFLTIATTIFISWVVECLLWQGLGFLLSAFIAAGVAYYLSRVMDALRPFQIFIEAIFFIVTPPALAFFLQSHESHRLLTMAVIGLIPTFLAFRLLVQLKQSPDDLHYGRKTIVTEIGWEKAMVLHNAMILLSYLLMALCAILGFPWFLLWPVFLTLPIGLLEIWLMERVRLGKKPLWRVMQVASASVFFIPIYLLGFAFWIR